MLLSSLPLLLRYTADAQGLPVRIVLRDDEEEGGALSAVPVAAMLLSSLLLLLRYLAGFPDTGAGVKSSQGS